MADKILTEAEWKKFAKGRELKDAPLLKALAAFEKSLKADADARLQALTEIDVQVELLKASKAVKGDKEVLAWLGQVDKAVQKERRGAEDAAQAEQDAEDSPAQLTTRMVPLMRGVRKGEAMNVMIALLGKETVVLVSRKSVGVPQRKVLSAQFEGSGTPKYLTGQCIFEENSHTFVLQAQATGLARKVKAALLEQTQMRFKVRVRGIDPNDIDDDGDEPVGDDESDATGAPAAPPAAESPDKAGGVNPADAFKARLTALTPRIQQALKAGGAQAAELKRLVTDAGTAARDKTFDVAGQLLDQAEQLLDEAAGASAPAPATPAATADEAAWLKRLESADALYRTVLAGNPAEATRLRAVMGYAQEQADAGQHAKAIAALDRLDGLLADAKATAAATDTGYDGLVAYRQTLLALRGAVASVDRQIDALKAAIPSTAPEEAELAGDLVEALHEYTSEVHDAVDKAMNAMENQAAPVTKAVADALDRFARDLRANPLVRHVDSNPFKAPVTIVATLGPALDAVRQAMPVPR